MSDNDNQLPIDVIAEIYERNERCVQMGALWNLLFPDERDDWDYPDQMYRLVFDEVARIRAALQDRAPELIDGIRAGRAPLANPKPFEWRPKEQ